MFAADTIDSLTGARAANAAGIGAPTLRSRYTPRDLVATVLYHRRAMAAAFMVPVLLAMIAAVNSKPSYVAQARLLVLYSSDYVYRPAAGQSGGSVALDRNQIVLGELQVLQSAVLANETIQGVGIDRLYPGTRGSDPVAASRAAARFEQDLALTSVPQSNILELSFRSYDPQVAADTLGVLIDKYLARRAVVFDRPSMSVALQDQSNFLDRLRTSEADLAAFADAHGISNLDAQIELLLRERSAAVQARDAAARDVDETQARLAIVQNELGGEPKTVDAYSDTDRSQQSQILTDSLVRLQIKRRDLTARYQDNFPAVRSLDQQIADMRAQLNGTSGRDGAAIRNGINPIYQDLTTQALALRAQLSGAQAKLTGLTAQAAAADDRLRELTKAGRDYRDLQRTRDVLDDSYRTVVRSNEEAEMSESAERNGAANVRVVQPPERPAIGTSLRKVIVAVGVVLGLIAALATVATLNAIRQVFVVTREVAETLHLPVLIVVDDIRVSEPAARRRKARPGAGRAPIAPHPASA